MPVVSLARHRGEAAAIQSLESLGGATKLSALSKCNVLKSGAQIWKEKKQMPAVKKLKNKQIKDDISDGSQCDGAY